MTANKKKIWLAVGAAIIAAAGVLLGTDTVEFTALNTMVHAVGSLLGVI